MIELDGLNEYDLMRQEIGKGMEWDLYEGAKPYPYHVKEHKCSSDFTEEQIERFLNIFN